MNAFARYRAERKISLAECAVELGLSKTSASWLSEIENGKRDASLRLALKIERWSDGAVPANSVCPELRDAALGGSAQDAAA